MDQLDTQVAAALERRAADVEPSALHRLEREARAQGRTLRRRANALRVATATGALIAVTGALSWGVTDLWSPEGDPSRIATKPEATDSPAGPMRTPVSTPTPAPTGPPQQQWPPRIDRCANVELPPPDTETNTMADLERGILSYSWYDPALGRDREYFIDYRRDETCKDNPSLLRLIRHATNP